MTAAPPIGLRIDLDRLMADLEALNRFGTAPGRPGINRPSYSAEDMAARRWLMDRMAAAGLTVRMDAVGNVVGRWTVGAGKPVLVGSHTDTVPDGGRFDGALGVVAALEAVRTLQEAGVTPARPIEVVATAEEEGRFGGMLGAQTLCGAVDPAWLAAARAEDGTRLVDALAACGLDPAGIADAARAPHDVAAFLELHIEQGPVLERAGRPIGLVDAISGVFNWAVTLRGATNHSGTTPMDLRRDAFQGLALVGQALAGIITAVGTDQSRLTIGRVELAPNVAHTIAGEARFTIIGRDADDRVMRDLAHGCRAAIEAAAEAHGLGFTIEPQSWLPPTRLDAGVHAVLQETAADLGLPAMTLPSGAGHDAQMFAALVPAGLIFVPSRAGISHAPEEWTDGPAIEAGATLLLHGLWRLAMASELGSAFEPTAETRQGSDAEPR